MTSSDFDRWIRPIQRKISFIISRALLKIVDNSTKAQLIQTESIGGGNSEVERLQPIGLETYPYTTDSTELEKYECVNLNIAGLEERAVNILVHNRDLRPNDLNPGETYQFFT